MPRGIKPSDTLITALGPPLDAEHDRGQATAQHSGIRLRTANRCDHIRFVDSCRLGEVLRLALRTNGRPRNFRFPGSEVWIKKSGDVLVLLAKGASWDSMLAARELFTADIMSNNEES